MHAIAWGGLIGERGLLGLFGVDDQRRVSGAA